MTRRKTWVSGAAIGVIAFASFVLYVGLVPEVARRQHTNRSAEGKQWKSGIHVAVVWPYLLQGSTILDRYYHRFPILANRLSRGPILRTRLEQSEESMPSFPQGMQMALEQLQESEANCKEKEANCEDPFAHLITLDRHFENEFMGQDDAVTLAKSLSADDSVVAVAGHYGSRGAIAASLVYEREKLLLITPTATIPQLTNHEFSFTFRLTPDDGDLAMSMAKFAKARHFRRIGIFYSRTPEGASLHPRIAETARTQGLDVAFIRSYFGGPDDPNDLPDFRPTIASVEKYKVDAIFLADALPRAAKLIKDLRSMNMRQPIIGSDYLQDPRLFDNAGDAIGEMYVTSAVDPESSNPNYLKMRERYKKRYPGSVKTHSQPSYPFSQGFETMTLLYEAIKRANSADPVLLSNRLRTDKTGWHGLFGAFRFALEGDIECRSLSVKRVDSLQKAFLSAERLDSTGAVGPFEYTPKSKGDDENEKCPVN